MSETFSLKGVNKAKLLAELFNNARPQGLGFLHYKAERVMTEEEADALLGETDGFDYLEGRVMKIYFGYDEIDGRLYDRDNGDGQFKRIYQKVAAETNDA